MSVSRANSQAAVESGPSAAGDPPERARDRPEARACPPGPTSLLRSKRRWQRVVFPGLQVAVLAVACAFWRYLGTGSWLPADFSDFLAAIRIPLAEAFTEPVDLFAYPWMILSFGLLLAAVVTCPVLGGLLYGLAWGLGLAGVVLLAGAAPMLAAAAGLGCVLASRTRLQTEMPFLAAVLGLLAPGVYLLTAPLTAQGWGTMLPLQRWVVYGPVVTAVTVSVIASAAALALVKLMGYRPGGLCLITSLLLAGAAGLFYAKVGPAEIAYAMIVRNLAPGDAIFEPFALEGEDVPWGRRLRTAGLDEAKKAAMIRATVKADLKQRRRALIERCEAFLREFPDTGHAAEILWIRAQARSLRVHEQAYRSGLVRYTARHPVPESAPLWEDLLTRKANSPQAAIARWRLAELRLRRQEPAEARRLLQEAREVLATLLRTETGEGLTGGPFFRPEPIPARAYYATALFEIERLLWLIEENHLLTDAESAAAMAALLSLDSTSPDYGEQLAALLDPGTERSFENTHLGDNLKLAVARQTPNAVERARMLVYLARELTDAAIEANYELAQLVLRRPFLKLIAEVETPEAYFRRVVQAPPNPWTRQAAEQLELLRAATHPASP